MKLNIFILAGALIAAMSLEATRKNESSSSNVPNHRASNLYMIEQSKKQNAFKVTPLEAPHEESPVLCSIDRCIITTGLLCCLPCIAIEHCYKKLFPRFKAS